MPAAADPLAANDHRPKLLLVAEHDQFAPPAGVVARAQAWRAATVETVPLADHFLGGAVRGVAERAVAFLRSTSAADAGPLARQAGRTVMPRAAITALASATVCSPKWKIEAASTASAPPSSTPSARWSSVPTPPLAMTGTPTASVMARVSSRSKPSRGAVAVHRGEQDLAGAAPLGLGRPVHRVTPRRRAAAVDDDLPALRAFRRRRRASIAHTTHWAPNSAAISLMSSGRCDGRGVHADLVGPGPQQPASVLHGADAAADGERDEHLLGGAARDVDHRVAAVGRRGDVEEHQLVGAFGVVAGGQLDRVAGVAQADEVHALHDAALGHVEAGDHPGGAHRIDGTLRPTPA